MGSAPLFRHAAVIGGGTMGADIAAVLLAGGIATCVVEPEAGRHAGLATRIAHALSQMGRPGAGEAAVHARLEDAPWATLDLVIECAPEKLALKQALFADLARLARPDAVIASNSSSYPVSEIARGLPSQQRMLGLHFFMPAHLVPAVEVIRSEATDPAVWERCVDLVRQLGKKPVRVAKDIPGFVANRLQHALMREAWHLMSEGLAGPEDIDNAVRYGFGLRYLAAGPVLQKDHAGLDIHHAAATTMYPDLARHTAPPPALADKVAQGRLGMKSGEGFWRWTPESAAAERERYERVLLEALAVLRREG